jgi:hypothetical protein
MNFTTTKSELSGKPVKPKYPGPLGLDRAFFAVFEL